MNTILEYPNLEADDCIALFVENLKAKKPEDSIYIIASDHDYLQLREKEINKDAQNQSRIEIYDLKFKSLMDHNNVFEDSIQNLFCKIVMGDKSDNIPPIFPKCGIKTAIKCYENTEFFSEKLKLDGVEENFHQNRLLIDFQRIPTTLKYNFNHKYKNIFH